MIEGGVKQGGGPADGEADSLGLDQEGGWGRATVEGVSGAPPLIVLPPPG